ncbi:MAG: HAMP domain-containing histidine kinase [Chloroflexi bacterium]|nr:HAMP domain-containing histidine kinase [Chloroflexota bacterium]MCI0776342.1 HAMP domain-containing histidine kinase [Chloroflexota bacterium]MCI0805020.1 HAMP domain-containing histidine kinase [Chloroflexota bacterium]MCI0809748.1 HAMP domain-containing histidine kinase [Chloroflexota bacterium]MCI0835375.1 HAMP domain-containing histidine kinase [Chloroflexota bacterium]
MQTQTVRSRTAAQTAGLFGMGKFRLTGLFLVVAGLTFLGVAIAINVSSARSEENRIIATMTEQSVRDARVIAGVVTELLGTEGNASPFPSDTADRPALVDISDFLGQSKIVRLRLYASDGRFIWGSTFDQSDVNMHQLPIFEKTANGTSSSGLIHGFTVKPPGGQPYRADVVETFIPFMDADTDAPTIVLGVTRDVTQELTRRISQTRSGIFRSTLISLSVGFIVLLIAVLSVDIRLWDHRVKAIEHERRLASQELASMKLDLVNRELQQINDERTRFLSTVSHELKTPLASIITLADILSQSQGGADKDRNLEHLEIVKTSGGHLLTLINELLDHSRLESGQVSIEREEFEVEEVVAELVRSMSPLLDAKSQSLVFECDFQGQRVRLDRRRLMQVLMNLVNNASKYSPEGTSVRIEGQILDGDLVLAVTDQGVGISEYDQARLFTKFFRGDNEATKAVSGTGLGLSITREIVEAHGGTVGVRSRIGHGARFSVTIPSGMPPVPSVPGSAERTGPTRIMARNVQRKTPGLAGGI